MSTLNFATANASKIFAFGFNKYPYLYLECCKDTLQRLGWDDIDENDWDRSYNTHFFAERVKAVKIAGITASVTVKAGATSGYYSGANFDWYASVQIDTVYNEYELTGRYALTAEDVVYDEWLENRGMCKIQRKNIIKRIYDTLRELVEECEDVFEQCSENRLACVGIFDNGEAIYEDLDTERG